MKLDLHTLKRFARFALERAAEDRIPQVAGSLTFTTVLSLVPLATVAFAVFTAFPIFASFQNGLRNYLAENLMPSAVNNQIFHYLNDFASKAKGLTTAGLTVLVVTSVATMMTVEAAFNVIWHVRKGRPFAQRLLVYWSLITLGPILFGMSLSLSSYVLSQSLTFSIPFSRQLSPITEWLLASAAFPLSVMAFTVLYVCLPNCKVAWRDGFTGGVLAAIAFELAKRGFGLYIRGFASYAAVYGAFAAVPIFLLWVYVSWLVTLFGATLVAALPAIRIGEFHRPPQFPGADLLVALQILARLSHERDCGRPGCTRATLARGVRRDAEMILRLLHVLEQQQWLVRLEGARMETTWLLVANPQRISVAALFALLVIDRNELEYQLALEHSGIDAHTLHAMLDAATPEGSLAGLIAPLAAADTAAWQPWSGPAGAGPQPAGATE